MKLGKSISWLLGNLQGLLFPQLEECWGTPLTEKEQRIVSVLELVRVEDYVPRTASTQWFGRKLIPERRGVCATESRASPVSRHVWIVSVISQLKRPSKNYRYSVIAGPIHEVSRNFGLMSIIDNGSRGKRSSIGSSRFEKARIRIRMLTNYFV